MAKVLEFNKKIEAFLCPRCGDELRAEAGMDPNGHYVTCTRCGHTNDLVSEHPQVVSDVEYEYARTM